MLAVLWAVQLLRGSGQRRAVCSVQLLWGEVLELGV